MSTLLTIGLLFTVGIICFFWGAVTEHRLKMKDKQKEAAKQQWKNWSQYARPITKPSNDLYERQENEIEKLKEEKGIFRQMSLTHFNSFLKERDERRAAQSRIKELEAALARAEGLNRSFAEGGVVSASINPKAVRL